MLLEIRVRFHKMKSFQNYSLQRNAVQLEKQPRGWPHLPHFIGPVAGLWFRVPAPETEISQRNSTQPGQNIYWRHTPLTLCSIGNYFQHCSWQPCHLWWRRPSGNIHMPGVELWTLIPKMICSWLWAASWRAGAETSGISALQGSHIWQFVPGKAYTDGSQLEEILPHKGYLTRCGAIFSCNNWGRGCYWHSLGRGWECY